MISSTIFGGKLLFLGLLTTSTLASFGVSGANYPLHVKAIQANKEVSPADRLRELKDILNRLDQPPPLKRGMCYYIRYSVQTYKRDTLLGKNTTLTNECAIGQERLQMRNEECLVEQDRHHAVCVWPKRRAVLIRKTGPHEMEQAVRNARDLSGFRVKLLDQCSVESTVVEHDQAGEPLVNMMLRFERNAGVPFERMQILYSPKRGELKKQILYYRSNEPLRAVAVTFHELDFAHPEPQEFSRSARDMVLNGKSLRAPFQGFALTQL